MTEDRYTFIWEHMYPHVSFENMNSFFQGLPSVIDLHYDKNTLLTSLCADENLMWRLYLSAGLRQLKPSLDEAGEDHDGLNSCE